MAHTITYTPARFSGIFTVTVTNYVAGGESFTLADFALNALPVLPVVNASNRNSLNALLFPLVVGGNLKLFQISGGVFSELPTTNGINAIFDVALLSGASS